MWKLHSCISSVMMSASCAVYTIYTIFEFNLVVQHSNHVNELIVFYRTKSSFGVAKATSEPSSI